MSSSFQSGALAAGLVRSSLSPLTATSRSRVGSGVRLTICASLLLGLSACGNSGSGDVGVGGNIGSSPGASSSTSSSGSGSSGGSTSSSSSGIGGIDLGGIGSTSSSSGSSSGSTGSSSGSTGSSSGSTGSSSGATGSSSGSTSSSSTGGLLGGDNGQVITLPGGIPVEVPGSADPAGTQTAAEIVREYEVPTPFPESITYDERTKAFYGAATTGGAVYKATLDGQVADFIPTLTDTAGTPDGRVSAQGVRAGRDGRLYVAGGPSGLLHVYTLPEGTLVGTFPTLPGAYLNDMDVAPNGDVYVTDSQLPFLYRFSAAQIAAGSGVPQLIQTTPEVGVLDKANDVNPLESNGLRISPDGRYVIFNSLNDHKLYRLTLPTGTALVAPMLMGTDRELREIAVEGDIGDSDGIDFAPDGTLYAMNNNDERVNKIVFSSEFLTGRIVAQVTSERFHTPTGVAVVGDLLLINNAELFDMTEAGPPFFVTAIRKF